MLTSALHERLSAIPPPVSPVLLQEKMLNAERKRKERLDKLVMREKAKVKRASGANPNQPADARAKPRPFRPDHAHARCALPASPHRRVSGAAHAALCRTAPSLSFPSKVKSESSSRHLPPPAAALYHPSDPPMASSTHPLSPSSSPDSPTTRAVTLAQPSHPDPNPNPNPDPNPSPDPKPKPHTNCRLDPR